MEAGSSRAWRERGEVLSTQYVLIDTIDFSSYLRRQGRDATYLGCPERCAPFVKQYNDYGLTGR